MTLRNVRISALASGLAATMALAACGSSSSSSTGAVAAADGARSGSLPATLNGAGSTLAAPIYQQWGSTLKSQGLTVNYSPVGSGAGQALL
jgi:phosphate transport system substrate-binding protein